MGWLARDAPAARDTPGVDMAGQGCRQRPDSARQPDAPDPPDRPPRIRVRPFEEVRPLLVEAVHRHQAAELRRRTSKAWSAPPRPRSTRSRLTRILDRLMQAARPNTPPVTEDRTDETTMTDAQQTREAGVNGAVKTGRRPLLPDTRTSRCSTDRQCGRRRAAGRARPHRGWGRPVAGGEPMATEGLSAWTMSPW